MSIRGLVTEFTGRTSSVVRAVDGVDLDLFPGEVLGVVGESGSGKSALALSALRLLPEAGRVTAGSVTILGRDILTMPDRQLRTIRGNDVGVVFQDPMTSLNPVLRVGRQISDVIRAHGHTSRSDAMQRAEALMTLVGFPDPPRQARRYPHEFSGGMRQRAMIAMAIANRPTVLIADEPTTALDVTIQAQILRVLDTARREALAATMFITHDLGIIAELADRVVVMYAGKIVERATVHDLFDRPSHPYTRALLGSRPSTTRVVSRLTTIPGTPPTVSHSSVGCDFEPRCAVGNGRPECRTRRPLLEVRSGGHVSACHFPDEVPA